MPIVKHPIKEQHKSIIRPVVIDVVNQLIKLMRLDADTEVIFNGHSDIAMMPNGMIGITTRNKADNIRTVGRKRIFIGFEEEPTETSLLEMPTSYPEQSCIFADNAIGITIRPIKVRTGVRLQIRNRFTSKAAADEWFTVMQQLIADYVKDYVHEATYNYAYPDEVLQALIELWKYRESQGGYDESFSQWFRSNSTQKLTAITNQAGAQSDLAIGETIDNVQGNWDFETPPYPTKANNLGSWQAEFSYRFEFDKTTSMVMYYPIIVHNQMLGENMLAKRTLPSYRGKNYAKPLQQTRYEGIQEDIGQSYDPRVTAWLMHPDYDEWQMPNISSKFFPQFQALLELNVEDLRSVVSLKELGPYQFTQRTLMYLRHVGSRVFHHHQSIIQIALFEDDMLLDHESLVLDPETFQVSTTYDLDIRKQYRIVVYIDGDLRRLWELAVDDLKDRGVWGQEVISVIYPGNVPPLDEDGHISDGDWRDLIDGIDWSKLPSTDPLYIGQFGLFARIK